MTAAAAAVAVWWLPAMAVAAAELSLHHPTVIGPITPTARQRAGSYLQESWLVLIISLFFLPHSLK